jgi:phytanoyl-CoA hydroxylase
MVDAAAYRQTGSVLVPSLVSTTAADGLRAEAWRVFKHQLQRHGLIGEGDLPEAELTTALYTYFREHTAEFANCGKQIQHLIDLHRLSLSHDVLAVVRELGLREPNISVRPVMFFNNPRLAKQEFYWKTPPHQDWRSMQGSLDSVVVWIALVDVDTDLGALEVVPGSHRRGLLADRLIDGFGQTDEFPDGDFVAVEMRKGDALFFSSFLVHRSGTNVTDAVRWSAQFRYNNLSEATFVERGYPHSFVYKPMDDLITPGFPSPAALDRTFG